MNLCASVSIVWCLISEEHLTLWERELDFRLCLESRLCLLETDCNALSKSIWKEGEYMGCNCWLRL